MTKKNRKKKNTQTIDEGVAGTNENPIEAELPKSGMEEEVDAVRESLIEAEQAAPEAEPVEIERDNQPEEMENLQGDQPDEDVQESEPSMGETDASQDDAMDDLLADVRHSLMEEDDAGKSEKKSSWWNRLVKGTSSQDTPAMGATAEIEKDTSVAEVALPAVEADKEDATEDVEEIDELIKLLETETAEDHEETSDTPAVVSTPFVEQEVKIDVDELKKQAFGPRAEGATAEELSDVRKIALAGEGDEQVFVEVDAKAQDPWEERIKSVENALRPYRTYIYYALAFIGVIMAVMASVLIYNSVKQSLPTPVATEALNLPYPTTISLPGGLNFNLAKGALKDGSWDPRGPEWLEGTEICRWVALPWSRQLEAAVRTMNRDDVMELIMSNNDKLTYQVESIQELTPAELQEMDSSSPCLALILAKQDSEKRWVAVGRP